MISTIKDVAVERGFLMEKEFKMGRKSFNKTVEQLVEYYSVKGYEIKSKCNGNTAAFVFTKNSLYRRLIGSVPVIIGMWTKQGEKVTVKVEGKMEHGFNLDINRIFERAFDITGYSITRKVVDFAVDPLFRHTLTDEFLLMSEGLLTAK